MTDDQQRARELLAMCLDEWGFPTEASNVRAGEDLEWHESEFRLLQQLRVFGLLRYPNEAAALRAAPGVDDDSVDLAAKALHANGADSLTSDTPWAELHEGEISQFRSWARAALIAARPQGVK